MTDRRSPSLFLSNTTPISALTAFSQLRMFDSILHHVRSVHVHCSPYIEASLFDLQNLESRPDRFAMCIVMLLSVPPLIVSIPSILQPCLVMRVQILKKSNGSIQDETARSKTTAE